MAHAASASCAATRRRRPERRHRPGPAPQDRAGCRGGPSAGASGAAADVRRANAAGESVVYRSPGGAGGAARHPVRAGRPRGGSACLARTIRTRSAPRLCWRRRCAQRAGNRRVLPIRVDSDSCSGAGPTVKPARPSYRRMPVSTPLFPQGKSWMAACAARTKWPRPAGQRPCSLVLRATPSILDSSARSPVSVGLFLAGCASVRGRCRNRRFFSQR